MDTSYFILYLSFRILTKMCTHTLQWSDIVHGDCIISLALKIKIAISVGGPGNAHLKVIRNTTLLCTES